MPRKLPAVATAIGFVDCINRGDVDGLADLMTSDHELVIFDEAPVIGRDANRAAWQGYLERWPEYVIYPRRVSERDGQATILGHTTGSHLELPDDEERELTLIWLADVVDGSVSRWRLVEDTPSARAELGLGLDD